MNIKLWSAVVCIVVNVITLVVWPNPASIVGVVACTMWAWSAKPVPAKRLEPGEYRITWLP